jgi:hypothetical protein
MKKNGSGINIPDPQHCFKSHSKKMNLHSELLKMLGIYLISEFPGGGDYEGSHPVYSAPLLGVQLLCITEIR